MVIGWLVTTFVTVSVVRSDIFSSTAHLQNLLHLERHMVSTMHDYIQKTESKLDQVKRYLNLFYDSYHEVLEEKLPSNEEMVDNPLQAYQLVRRLAVDWDKVKTAMSTDDWNPIRRLVNDYRQLLPNLDDLKGAALAIIRLQDTYKLDIGQVAEGSILDRPQGTGLTARDLLYLGKQCFNAGYYGHAILWMQEALKKAHTEGNRTASVAEVNAFYDPAVDMHDNLFERSDLDVRDYDTLTGPLRPRGNVSLMTSAVLPPSRKLRLGPDITSLDEQANYMALCRGETLVTPSEESKLRCHLDGDKHPYFLLRPLRIEERGLDPYVIQIHDLLTSNQTDVLKQIAEPKLSRSLVQASKGSEVVSLSRTSQNAWVGPYDHPLMTKVYRLVEMATGLSTKAENEHAEIVQIANYGIGGHYTPHHDYLIVDKTPEELEFVPPKELDAGDRTATLMFYLSDVTRGGATVFPKAGASVWPKKGSAVFWYNLKRSGKEDPMTLHGACPVAVGSKWVANFWMREKGQTFKRRCDPNPEL